MTVPIKGIAMTQDFQTSNKTRIIYPLHGRYLQEIKETLKNKRGER